MDKFLSSVQSFIHSVTTNDRYASYESQYRSSNNTRSGGSIDNDHDIAYNPTTSLNNNPSTVTDQDGFSRVGIVAGRNSSATSVDQLNQVYQGGGGAPGATGSNTNLASSGSQTSLNRVQYQPGMKSSQIGNGIPLQDYADGVVPPPAPGISWRRIDKWLDIQYPELFDQVSEGATSADLNELESDLDCTLPLDVRDSYMIHDGQESGGHPTGIIFSITLLDLEGIAEEWLHWKNTAVRINRAMRNKSRVVSNSSEASSSSSAAAAAARQGGPPRLRWLEHQESVPDGAIQRVYAHPGWVPLAKDGEGNNIGIDLAPGPRGRWGQVILFGRDFDRKYVVSPNWATFLATFADDLEGGDHYVFDDVEEGELRFRAPNGRLVSYFDVLRSRVDRQIRQQRKQAMQNNQNRDFTKPSSAAASRQHHGQGSASSTRNSSPNNLRKISSPRPEGNLISPMGSSTNLPATGLPKSNDSSTNLATTNNDDDDDDKKTNDDETETKKADAETETETVTEPENVTETETKSEQQPEDQKAQKSESPEPEPKPEQASTEEEPSTPATAETKTTESSKKKDGKEEDHDEVDLLKDDMTEVEI